MPEVSGGMTPEREYSEVDTPELQRPANQQPFGRAFEPVYHVGPIGSRSDTLYFTPKCGGLVSTGCFIGTLAEFKAAVQRTHGNNHHGQMYFGVIGWFMTVLEDYERTTPTYAYAEGQRVPTPDHPIETPSREALEEAARAWTALCRATRATPGISGMA